MQKRAPTLGNMVVIILFVLSCFGLLLFLWESFGGPLPLKPKGYQVTVAFPRQLSLAEQSDVRISGVQVGHVISVKPGSDGLTHATIEIAGRYAPLRSDMRAMLRTKGLLGETYVQLIPVSRTAPFLPDKGRLANSQVEPSVTLDGVLATFDPKTRRNFQVWQQALAEGVAGRGEQINAGFATVEPFVQHSNELVGILASQEGALRRLVKNTGVVFSALAGRDRQLEGLITNGEHTFHAAAGESQAWAEAWRALPAFEATSIVALRALDRFAAIASPFYEEFRPAEVSLARLLGPTKTFAPEFSSFLTALGPATSAAKTGLPDVAKTLRLTTPILENFRPVLHNFDPFLQFLSQYIPELQAFFANFTASTQAHVQNSNTFGQGPTQHYLRAMQVLGPESLAVYPQRIGTARPNPYFKPGVFRSLGSLQVFSSGGCANSAPSVSGPPNATISQSLIEQIIQFGVANSPGAPNNVAAPPCVQQGPFTFNGQTSQFPHVVYGGK